MFPEGPGGLVLRGTLFPGRRVRRETMSRGEGGGAGASTARAKEGAALVNSSNDTWPKNICRKGGGRGVAR